MSKNIELDLSQETLKEFLDYSPETGIFIWKKRSALATKIGTVAGNLNALGYIRIRFLRHGWMAHRLAWLFVHGEMPLDQIDHIDCDKSNNKIGNLRQASTSENLRNRKKSPRNTSGFKGVTWHKLNNKWLVACRVNGVKVHLGYYKDPEEASKVYLAFAKKCHGEFFHEKPNE